MILAAYLIGAFYVFAGLVAIQAGRMDLFVDNAIAALAGKPEPLAERLRGYYAIAVGALTLAGGVALLFVSRWAVPLFLACAALQGFYLLWAARALPPKDAEQAKGRKASTNAFVIYSAATAFVVWLYARDHLH